MPIGLWLLSFVSFCLEAAVTAGIIRAKEYRRFAVLLALSIFAMFGVVSSVLVIMNLGVASPTYSVLYSAYDVISHGLIIVLILSLIEQSTTAARNSSRFMVFLAGAVVLGGFGFLAVSLLYHFGIVQWTTPVSRDLSLCEEILNFVLWGALVRSRRRDSLLLLVTAGIGLQVTGEVIGHTIRLYASQELLWLPDLIVLGSELLCGLIWNYAFWTAPVPARVGSENAGAT